MKLQKAIEILKAHADFNQDTLDQLTLDALKLGIEAMQKWKLLRQGRAGVIDPLLPGETEE